MCIRDSITGDVVWFSDIEGKIGEGDSTTALLKTPGSHTITANLNEYSDSITILVTEYKPRLIPYGIVLDLKGAVSYTHLRAHETPEHLVCRLLLEKKKKNTNNIVHGFDSF